MVINRTCLVMQTSIKSKTYVNMSKLLKVIAKHKWEPSKRQEVAMGRFLTNPCGLGVSSESSPLWLGVGCHKLLHFPL